MLITLLVALGAHAGTLEGEYRYAGTSAERAATAALTEETVQSFSWALRPLVRSKLEKVMAIPAGVHVSRDGQTLTVRVDEHEQRCTLGQATAMGDGSTLTCATTGDGYTLHRTGDQGGRRTWLAPTETGLRMTSTLYGEQLGQPRTWTLTFSRVGQTAEATAPAPNPD